MGGDKAMQSGRKLARGVLRHQGVDRVGRLVFEAHE
jgi:hypothetical protein